MPQQTAGTAVIMCTFSMGTPSVFNATPRPVLTQQLINGVITDVAPGMNITPFPICNTPSNPAVAAATAAALGVLTPAPCTYVPAGTWFPGATNIITTGIPALDNNCKLMCAWGGMISINFPAQVTHQIP